MSRSDKGVPVFGEKGGFAVGKDGEVNTVGAAIGRPVFMGSSYYYFTPYTARAAEALTFVPCDKSKQKRTFLLTVVSASRQILVRLQLQTYRSAVVCAFYHHASMAHFL